MSRLSALLSGFFVFGLIAGCDEDPPAQPIVEDASEDLPQEDEDDQDIPRQPPPTDEGIYGYAGGCVAIEGFDGSSPPRHLAPVEGGERFAFGPQDVGAAASFHMRASDLGTYLFYDAEAHYLSAAQGEGGGTWRFERPGALTSGLLLLDDSFKSPAEWVLQASSRDPERYQLQHRASGLYMATQDLVAEASEAAIITLQPREGCADFPELTVDAIGAVVPRQWEDGDVYGIAEIHSHMMTNFGFGGGGIFHGAPFHRLGVEHALPDCAPFHGDEGRRDLAGFFFDGGSNFDIQALLPIVLSGEAQEFNHFTAGYPEFTQWPNSWARATHQTMYYRWLERAWLGGLRLVVQHATGNSVLCELITGLGAQDVRYACNDMVSVDRSIQEMHNLERYIDAQSGGPGEGWLRIVESPEEARQVINEGRLAVVLGIEISNLLDCFLTPREGFEACTPESVRASLDRYEALGVRAIFPVHKYDNAFSAGDGSGGIIELGNFINTGHYSNFVEDCPGPRAAFDGGGVTFGGLNQPRDDFGAHPPVDMSDFADNVAASLFPFIEEIRAPGLAGDYCQKQGLTPLGEVLIEELMSRGMIIDLAHLPQRSLGRAYELLEAADYPATKTHGNANEGRLYALGGLTGVNLGRCSDPDDPGGMIRPLLGRVEALSQLGAYPSEALSFDLNGFAGGPRPRFGDDSRCNQPQANPITYPFTSHDGHITFQPPQLGLRAVDFNTEGMIHIGLLPELIEDLRRDGATDEALEPLFRSAEAYLRLWEKARAQAVRSP